MTISKLKLHWKRSRENGQYRRLPVSLRFIPIRSSNGKRELVEKEHQIYPYLLRDVSIDKPDVAWATDITSIRLKHGFVYLVAVMDLYSRYIVSWRISNTLETDFCCEALKEALERGKPEYFNTDQGAQFTSKDFTSILKSENIQISMDGKGQVIDNIFIERFWRTLK